MASLSQIKQGLAANAKNTSTEAGDGTQASAIVPSVRIKRGGNRRTLNRRGSFQLAGRVPKTRRRSIVASTLNLDDKSRRWLEEVREEVFALVWRGKAFSLAARIARLCVLALLYISLMSLITETVEFEEAPSLVSIQ